MISDVLFFSETCRNGDVWAQEEILTRYRRHGAQLTATNNMEHPDRWIALQILELKYPDLLPYIHAVRAEYNFIRGFLLLADGKHEASRTYLQASLFYRKRVQTLFWLLFSHLPAGVQAWARTTKTRLRTRKERLA